MKSTADDKTKEIEAKDFIISFLENYGAGKTLPLKKVSNATITPVQDTFLKSIMHRAKKSNPD